MTDIFEIAEYVLDKLKALGADEAECMVAKNKKDEFNADNGNFSLMRTTLSTNISLKAVKDKKSGAIHINQATSEAIDLAAAQCMAAIASAVADEFEGIAPFTAQKEYEAGIKNPDANKLFDRTAELLQQAESEYPKVTLEQVITDCASSEVLYANTNGTRLSCKSGGYSFSTMFSAHDGEKTSSFNGYFSVLKDLEKPFIDIGIQRRLFAESQKQIETVSSGEKFVGKVIFSPDCFGDLLHTTIGKFATESGLISGTSPWKNSLNTKIASDKLTLKSIPLDNRIVAGQRFTSDGYPTENIEIIANGILKTFILSFYGSRKTGFPRSLNGGNNFEVIPGDTSLEDMIKSVDKGLLVNRISGGNPSSNGDFSAVAKNSFIIENGKTGSAVSETMISGNILDMLNNIVEISEEQVNDGKTILPWVEIDGVTVSGK